MLARKHYVPIACVLSQLVSIAASASCESFEIDDTEHGPYSTSTYPISFFVSDQVNCTGTNLNRPEPGGALSLDCNATQCANGMPPDHMVRVNTTLDRDRGAIVDSIGSLADRESIMTFISRAGDGFPRVDFNTSKAYPIGSQAGSCMDRDTAGHWGFTAFTACFYGTVGPGCDEIEEGMRVRACAPYHFSEGSEAIDGAIGWVQTFGVEDVAVPEAARREDDVLLNGDDAGGEGEDGGDGDESDAASVGVASSVLLVTLGALSAAWSLA
jgi:hypothetical protein